VTVKKLNQNTTFPSSAKINCLKTLTTYVPSVWCLIQSVKFNLLALSWHAIASKHLCFNINGNYIVMIPHTKIFLIQLNSDMKLWKSNFGMDLILECLYLKSYIVNSCCTWCLLWFCSVHFERMIVQCLEVGYDSLPLLCLGQDSVVGLVMDSPGIKVSWRQYFPHPFRLALGLT
jgi:hypothetical protein